MLAWEEHYYFLALEELIIFLAFATCLQGDTYDYQICDFSIFLLEAC